MTTDIVYTFSQLDSKYTDPTTWRQKINGIPIRVVTTSGNFAKEDAVVTRVVLIQSSRLIDFANSVLPRVDIVAGKPVWTAPHSFYTSDINLYAEDISWQPHVPGKPADPFGEDPVASTQTYQDILEVTITYKPLPPDARNFLTIQGRASMEYLHIVSPDTKYEGASSSAYEENRDPHLPVQLTVPVTEWTVTWHRLPRSIWNETVYPLVRSRLGKVNDTPFIPLFSAPQDTVLFTGFNFRDQYTWRNNKANPAYTSLVDDYLPVTVEFMFKERHVTNSDEDGATVHGWNSVYVPSAGEWRNLRIGGDGGPEGEGELPYKRTDMNALYNLLQTGITPWLIF